MKRQRSLLLAAVFAAGIFWAPHGAQAVEMPERFHKVIEIEPGDVGPTAVIKEVVFDQGLDPEPEQCTTAYKCAQHLLCTNVDDKPALDHYVVESVASNYSGEFEGYCTLPPALQKEVAENLRSEDRNENPISFPLKVVDVEGMARALAKAEEDRDAALEAVKTLSGRVQVLERELTRPVATGEEIRAMVAAGVEDALKDLPAPRDDEDPLLAAGFGFLPDLPPEELLFWAFCIVLLLLVATLAFVIVQTWQLAAMHREMTGTVRGAHAREREQRERAEVFGAQASAAEQRAQDLEGRNQRLEETNERLAVALEGTNERLTELLREQIRRPTVVGGSAPRSRAGSAKATPPESDEEAA